MIRYAVDLDGVIFDSNAALIQVINRRFATSYAVDDIRAWNWDAWCTPEHAAYAWRCFAQLVEQGLPFLPGAEAGLRRLHSAGGAALITHRTPDLVELTTSAVAQLPRHCVRHVDVAQDKVHTALQLGCTVAIEDSPTQAVAYAEAGLRVYLMAYPYNMYVRHPQVRRVAGWQEILRAEEV